MNDPKLTFEDIQDEKVLVRSSFSEAEKGMLAKEAWDNPTFVLGMQYGYILCLKEIKGKS